MTTLLLSALRVWPGNPRKLTEEDLGKPLDALAESIRAKGIEDPLKVRALDAPEGPVTHEVLDGQRRLHAALRAGLIEVPVQIRKCTDDEALELALTSNGQRTEMQPLDEARAIAQLAQKQSHEELAKKLGRTSAWVRHRLALLTLGPEAVALLEKRELPLTQALQLAALSLTEQTYLLDCFRDGVPSAKAFAQRLRHLMHRLANAPFDTKDATLPGDACTACDTRSDCDAQQELFGKAVAEEASCLDRACWDGKVEAIWTRATKSAKRRKLQVLNSEDVFTWADKIRWDAPWQPASKDLPAAAIARTEAGFIVELATKSTAAETKTKSGQSNEDEDPASEARDERASSWEKARREREAELSAKVNRASVLYANQGTRPGMLRYLLRQAIYRDPHTARLLSVSLGAKTNEEADAKEIYESLRGIPEHDQLGFVLVLDTLDLALNGYGEAPSTEDSEDLPGLVEPPTPEEIIEEAFGAEALGDAWERVAKMDLGEELLAAGRAPGDEASKKKKAPAKQKPATEATNEEPSEALLELLKDLQKCKSAEALEEFWSGAVSGLFSVSDESRLVAAFWEKADKIGLSARTEKKMLEAGSAPPRPVTPAATVTPVEKKPAKRSKKTSAEASP